MVSFNVVALYDSLNIEIVIAALRDAISKCRPHWNTEFINWLIELITLSFDSAFVKFHDNWYESIFGCPTGGKTSVDLANITVYYIFHCLIYDLSIKPTELLLFMRFVDDGLGIWSGTKDSFKKWFDALRNSCLNIYKIDLTYNVYTITESAQFLDISLSFIDGKLSTDLYRKPTDANRYLHYSSYHPRHVFRSIIYSQGLRYRRIINDNDTFCNRLSELKTFFVRSSYPKKLVDDILDPLMYLPRCLDYNNKEDAGEKKFITPWIATFGAGYDVAKNLCPKLNEKLSLSETWKDSDIPVLHMVARKAPTLQDKLFKRKSLALRPLDNAIQPCSNLISKRRGPKCICCTMVGKNSTISTNGVTVTCAGGNCKSNNIIYCIKCKICTDHNCYVGKTVSELHSRISQHRSHFNKLLRKQSTSNHNDFNTMEVDDEQILGVHLYFKHGMRNSADFNSCYSVDILSNYSPRDMRRVEQLFIDKLKTLTPYGLNQCNSVGD